MKEQLRLRLDELKREYALGQNRLRELETQQVNVQQTLLRISGAIQVLEEFLTDAPHESGAGVDTPAASAAVAGNGLVGAAA